MNNTEYQNELSVLVDSFNHVKQDHKRKIHELRLKYVSTNHLYNVGDYLYNVTGIIKVSKIDYVVYFNNNVGVTYTGLRYKRWKGVLSRTKSNRQVTFAETEVKSLNIDDTQI